MSDDETLPQEVEWILRNAFNKIEAAHLLRLYRHYGIDACVEKGLWLNKRRSPIGRENWQEYQRRKRRARSALVEGPNETGLDRPSRPN